MSEYPVQTPTVLSLQIGVKVLMHCHLCGSTCQHILKENWEENGESIHGKTGVVIYVARLQPHPVSPYRPQSKSNNGQGKNKKFK